MTTARDIAAIVCFACSAAASAVACDARGGAVLEVGPGQTLQTPSAAAKVATNGTTVRIAAGDYRGDVAVWSASRLTICGVGGRARLFADGRSAQGKGIWVVTGDDVTIEGVEFHGARVPDRNGAGIRAQHGGALRIVDSGFFDNENGILSSNRPDVTIAIERSEFARNGHGDGQSHNLYVGSIARLTVTDSFFHEAKVGHNLKSRARISRIETSYLMDGPEGNSSYLADFPDGGEVVLRGNLFHKGPRAENPYAIAFGAEGLKAPVNTLTLVHNTIVVTRAGGAVLSIAGATQAVHASNNLFATTGPATGIFAGTFDPGRAVLSGNVTLTADQLPEASKLPSPSFWPVPRALRALRLRRPGEAGLAADSPRPLEGRPLTGPESLAGALQSTP